MKRYYPHIALATAYFAFAILLNSVGVVILQSIESFSITKSQASVLEGFKDLSIAFVSFFIASLLPRIGYKLALLAGLSLVLVATVITPVIPNFWMIKILFAAIGTGFALVKVAVYSVIGQLTANKQQHSSLMNTIEGIFMLGTLFGYWLFSWFIAAPNTGSTDWLAFFWVLSGFLFLSICFVLIAPIKKNFSGYTAEPVAKSFVKMLSLTYQPLVLVFVISVFLYVLIEQSIGTWLPTFNKEVIGLSVELSVQMTSIFAAGLALGRLAAGQLLKRFDWFVMLQMCLVLISVLILAVLPMTNSLPESLVSTWSQAPLAAYILPMVGFFMAPIYPILNSVILSSLPKANHAPMTGLIVVFSALDGTTGSFITGNVFQFLGGESAFYFTLLPLVCLFLCLFKLKALANKVAEEGA